MQKEPGSWWILLLHIGFPFLCVVSPHHVAKVVVQQLVSVLPLIGWLWDAKDSSAPPGIGTGTLRFQRGPNLGRLLLERRDVPKRELALETQMKNGKTTFESKKNLVANYTNLVSFCSASGSPV